MDKPDVQLTQWHSDLPRGVFALDFNCIVNRVRRAAQDRKSPFRGKINTFSTEKTPKKSIAAVFLSFLLFFLIYFHFFIEINSKTAQYQPAMNEKPAKSGVGRPAGSTKPKVSSMPVMKLKIEVSHVQFQQLEMLVQRSVGKSPEAIVEAWISAEIAKHRAEGKMAPEATVLQIEAKEENVAAKKPQPLPHSRQA